MEVALLWESSCTSVSHRTDSETSLGVTCCHSTIYIQDRVTMGTRACCS